MNDLNNEEKMKFSSIMFQSQGREDLQIQKLSKQQVSKLRQYYAQKIAFDAANGQNRTQNGYDGNYNSAPTGFLGALCCCFYPEQHRDKFDVKTRLFIKRFAGSFLIFKSDFLSIGSHRIELYGALWLTLSYILILALAANLNEYFIQPTNYKFNNTFLFRALGIVALFKIAQPFIYSAVIKCLGSSIKNIESAMLTGYSVTLYMIPTILCFLPSLYWHVGMLALAGLARTIFLFRNYSSKLESNKIALLAVAAIMEAFYGFIVVKSMFPRDSGYTFSEGSRKVFHEGLVLRQYEI